MTKKEKPKKETPQTMREREIFGRFPTPEEETNLLSDITKDCLD